MRSVGPSMFYLLFLSAAQTKLADRRGWSHWCAQLRGEKCLGAVHVRQGLWWGCDKACPQGPSSRARPATAPLSSYFLKKRYIDFYVKSYCFSTSVFPKHGSKTCVSQTEPLGTRFARGLRCLPSGLQASGSWLLCTVDKQNMAFSSSAFWGHLVTHGPEALDDTTRWFR